MNRLRKALISKETELRLKRHGFLLDVNWDDDAPNPDINAKVSFVYSEDNETDCSKSSFSFKDHDFNIDSAVAHYCKQTLHCDVSDIVWLPIYEDGDDYINYSTEPLFDSELSGVTGFVYAKKDSDFGKTEKGFYDYVVNHLSIKADWRNNRVFRLYLITDGVDEGEGSIVVARGGLYSSDHSVGKFMNAVDETANKMIDSAIAAIDNTATYEPINHNSEKESNALSTLVVELSIDQSKVPENHDITRYIINEVEKRCRVKVAIGSFDLNKERSHLTVNFLFSSLPLLANLEKQSNKSLINEIQESQKMWGAKPHKMAHTMDEMLNAKSYEEYNSYMIQALMRVLFGTAEGVFMNIAHRKMVSKSIEQET